MTNKSDLAPNTDASSLASVLGLKDGEFNVMRSDGTVEKGWTIVDRLVHPEGTEDNRDAVIIEHPSDDGNQVLRKAAYIEDLLTLQPESQISEEIASEAGEVAVAGAVEPLPEDVAAELTLVESAEEESGEYDWLFDDSILRPKNREDFDLSYPPSRAEWLDMQLNNNKERPLPDVSLEPRKITAEDMTNEDSSAPRIGDPKVPTTLYEVISPEDQSKVGFVVLKNPDQYANKTRYYYIGDIKIFDGDRGKGFGPATYLQILKSLPVGSNLRTEGVLSGDAKRVWEVLQTKGIAKPSDLSSSPTGFETTF